MSNSQLGQNTSCDRKKEIKLDVGLSWARKRRSRRLVVTKTQKFSPMISTGRHGIVTIPNRKLGVHHSGERKLEAWKLGTHRMTRIGDDPVELGRICLVIGGFSSWIYRR
jgi:hypothetical protein